MLNDNTTNLNPINDLNDLPITLEEDEAMQALEKANHAAPTQPEGYPTTPEHTLMASLIRTFTKHIETLVDQRFAALVESHRTLALMDEGMREKIEQLVDDRVCAHEDSYDHKTDGDIESEVSDLFDHYMRQGNHDFITERNLSEKVGDVLDEILEDRVRDVIDNATVNISI